MDVPDPVVSIGKRCETYRVEMVIRGYLTGHAGEYKAGGRLLLRSADARRYEGE